MEKIIKNLKVKWSWNGDFQALKGFSITILPEGEKPNDSNINSVANTTIKINEYSKEYCYTFKNLTLDKGQTYYSWIQALYDEFDSEWVNNIGGQANDDGKSTIAMEKDLEDVENNVGNKINFPINKNSTFTDWIENSNLPVGWEVAYGNQYIQKENNFTKVGSSSVRFLATTQPCAMKGNVNLFIPDLAESQYISLELDFRLMNSSNSLSGAGLIFKWKSKAGNENKSLIPLKDLVTNPQTNKWYSIKLTIKNDLPFNDKFDNYEVVLCSNAQGNELGELSNKEIIYDRLIIRESTQIEIDAFENNKLIPVFQGWQVKGKVTIDGGKIEADTIESVSIKTGSLTISKFAEADLDKLLSKLLNIKCNYSSWSTLTNKSCYIHGYDRYGVPRDVDGKIYYNENTYPVIKGYVKSTTQFNVGYILYDPIQNLNQRTGANGITIQNNLGHQKCCVVTFYRNTWCYDNGNGSLVPFEPLATDLVIGGISNSGSNRIENAFIFGVQARLLTSLTSQDMTTDTLNSWRGTDSTTINGGVIETNTIRVSSVTSTFGRDLDISSNESIKLKVSKDELGTAMNNGSKFRYIRDSLSSNNSNNTRVWSEIKVLKNNVNIAQGKTVTANFTPTSGSLSNITDNNTSTNCYVAPSNNGDISWIKIDLGTVYEDIDLIQIYHAIDNRIYSKHMVEISLDNVNWKKLYDSDLNGTHTETSDGYSVYPSISGLDKKINEANNKYAELKIESDRINEKVVQVTTDVRTVTEYVNDMEIGTRNLLLGTKDFSKGIANATIISEKLNGNAIIKTIPFTSNFVDSYSIKTSIIPIAKQYTVSFYAKADENDVTINCHFYNPNTTTSSINSQGYKSTQVDGLSTFKISTTWKKYWVTWTQNIADTPKTIILGRTFNNKPIYLSSPVLVEGNKSIDYTEAPEDIQDRINKTVKSVDVFYAINTSSTIAPTTGWQTTPPTWENGKFIWSKTITTLSDNSISETSPVCITGAKGDLGNSGSDGRGIASITEEYYLSTSKTTQTGGSWQTTPPTWIKDRYIWTRSKIVYNNPTSTEYTTPICDSSWDAVNDLTNMLTEGKMLYKDPNFRQGTNNLGSYASTGTLTRILKPSDCPSTSTHCLEIKCTVVDGNSRITGFYPMSLQSRANAIFIEKFIAKLPIGYRLITATNSMGSGFTDRWLTSNEGTGNWETYIREIKCGSSGTFSTGGHVYVLGTPLPTTSNPFIWYLAYATVFDVTDNDETLNNFEKEITETKTQLSETNKTATEISNKVTTIGNTVTTINGQVVNQETRLKTAESKITDSAIMGTISNQLKGSGKIETSNMLFYNAGLEISHSEIGTKTLMTAKGFKILNSKGEEVGSLADEFGLTILRADEVYANNIYTKTRYDSTYYIDYKYGFDGKVEDGYGTNAKPFKTVNHLIDICPKFIEKGATMYIYIKTNTYESIVIQNFMGFGKIRLYISKGVGVYAPIRVQNCTTNVYIEGYKTYMYDNNCGVIDISGYSSKPPAAIYCETSTYVRVQGLNIKSNSSNGVQFESVAGLVMWCDINYCNSAIASYYGANVYIEDCCGSNNNIGVETAFAGIAHAGHPSGSKWNIPQPNKSINIGGMFNFGSGVVCEPSRWLPPPAPSTKIYETTWGATSTKTWGTMYGWDNDSNALRQGNYGYGNRRGFMYFDASSIRSSLSGASIHSIQLRLRRNNSGGNSGGGSVYLYGHGYTSGGGGNSLSTNYGNIGTWAWGEDKWVSLPSSVGEAFKNGSIQGLAMWSDSGNPYMVFDGFAELWIKYEK